MPARPRDGWRAVGLALLALGLSVVHPLPLMAIPFLVLLVALPPGTWSAGLAGVLAALAVFGGVQGGSWWYLERGWAVLLGGWFAALTLWRPASTFIGRALGAVAGSFAVAGAYFLVRPQGWAAVDARVRNRILDGVDTTLTLLGAGGAEGAVSPQMASALRETAEVQGSLFPALLGLGSVAALGVAWWLHRRLASREERALGPLRDFRFRDELVWVFVAGLALLLVGGAATRIGSNTVLFMGALYALRGLAVVVFVGGGFSFGGILLLAFATFLMAPVVMGAALLVGLGDTWLDLRERVQGLSGSEP